MKTLDLAVLREQTQLGWSDRFRPQFERDDDMPPGVFIHVHKCGGTALKTLLFGVGMKHNVIAIAGRWAIPQPGYIARYTWWRQRHPDHYRRAFKFTFIRNTWDRVISNWLFFRQRHAVFVSLEKFLDLAVTKQGRAGGKPPHRAIKQMVNHLIPFSNEDAYHLSEMDFIGRLEHFERDLRYVLEQLGLGDYDGPMPRRNWTTRDRPYTDYYTDETRDLVARHYAKDIETFGFVFGG